jgi:hypothetical protein
VAPIRASSISEDHSRAPSTDNATGSAVWAKFMSSTSGRHPAAA